MEKGSVDKKVNIEENIFNVIDSEVKYRIGNKMSNEQNVVVLRPSKGTNTKSLASAMARELEKQDTIYARAIGVQAISQTVKAVAVAGGFVGQRGRHINMRVGFEDVEVADKEEKITAILFTLTLG
jgi:stage V sporulation protein SpoVS